MITLRPSQQRGHAHYGWLDTRHTFSFANYYHPEHMGFRQLRVINEDRVIPGAGFPTHPHRDMEIISYIVEGALEHKDSLGHGSVIRPGDVQRMSAGTGVTHSEFNHSQANPLHFLQIWIHPEAPGIAPSYEQKHFSEAERTGRLRLVASRTGRDGSISLHQDVDLYASLLPKGAELTHTLQPGRHAWVQLIEGELAVGDTVLRAGDGAAVSNLAHGELTLRAQAPAHFLLFDLA